MKFENIKVFNFENALRGMRNPKESWAKSDSYFGIIDDYSDHDYDIAQAWLEKKYPEFADDHESSQYYQHFDEIDQWLIDNGVLSQNSAGLMEVAFIGPNDMGLAQNLIKAGSEHRKFMRQIFVTVDITAPLYWWKEFDTYKVGTVANSTSTMHKITSKPITRDCFEMDDFDESVFIEGINYYDGRVVLDRVNFIIDTCEILRKKYLETKDVRYWKELIRWLPESWLQTRTVTMDYENLLAMCSKGQRRFHKLTEWSKSFIDMARSLPYASELIFLDEQEQQN